MMDLNWIKSEEVVKGLSETGIEEDCARVDRAREELSQQIEDLRGQVAVIHADSYHEGFKVVEAEEWDSRVEQNETVYSLEFDGKEFNFPGYSSGTDKQTFQIVKNVFNILLTEGKNGDRARELLLDVRGRYDRKVGAKGLLVSLREQERVVSGHILRVSSYRLRLQHELERRVKLEERAAWTLLEQFAMDQDLSPIEVLQQYLPVVKEVQSA